MSLQHAGANSEHPRGDVFAGYGQEKLDRAVLSGLPFHTVPLNSFDSIVEKHTGIASSGFIDFLRYGTEVISQRIDNNYGSMPSDFKPSIAFLEYTKDTAVCSLAYRISQSEVVSPPRNQKFTESFHKANLGTASPEELIDMFLSSPAAFNSLEIANQSTPFLWNQTDEMDEAVATSLVKAGFEPIQEPSRYYCVESTDKVDSSNPDVKGAMTVLRKDVIGYKDVEGGHVLAIRPVSFDLDFNHHSLSDLQEDLVDYNNFRIANKPDKFEKSLEHNKTIMTSAQQALVTLAIRRSGKKLFIPSSGQGVMRYKTPLKINESYLAQKVVATIETALKTAQDGKPNLGVHPSNTHYYSYFIRN